MLKNKKKLKILKKFSKGDYGNGVNKTLKPENEKQFLIDSIKEEKLEETYISDLNYK